MVRRTETSYPDDPYDPQRFVDAQFGVYARALGEIGHGRKTSHWMWFVFPQIAGPGQSSMSRRYAIASLDEARAYLAHPVLGARYRECVEALGDLPQGTAESVFGTVDAMKLQSSLTLFTAAAPDERLFVVPLERWCGGYRDRKTLALLERSVPLQQAMHRGRKRLVLSRVRMTQSRTLRAA